MDNGGCAIIVGIVSVILIVIGYNTATSWLVVVGVLLLIIDLSTHLFE